MKKILLLCFVIFVSVSLVGCGNKSDQTNSTSTQKDNGILGFSNLKDAFSSKDSLKCTYEYNDTDNAYKGTIYMKDDKFKTVMGFEDKKMNSLFDGNSYYSWMDGQAQGFKMNQQCLNEISQDGVKTDDFDPNESFFSIDDFDSAFQVKCEKSDIDLSIPNNIDFQDMCELLKNLTNAFENINFDLDQ